MQVKDVPVLTKTNINDPLDLLQPVYEEVTKDVPLQLGRNSLGKLRGSTRKTRKRKLVDYVEEREEVKQMLASNFLNSYLIICYSLQCSLSGKEQDLDQT